jgi:hypothetical protein
MTLSQAVLAAGLLEVVLLVMAVCLCVTAKRGDREVDVRSIHPDRSPRR